MSLHVSTLAQKIAAVERMVVLLREGGAREVGDTEFFEAVKAVAADLRARERLPRNNALGELERALVRLKSSKGAGGYDAGKMVAVANVVVSKWPVIRQALEQFGEDSAQ